MTGSGKTILSKIIGLASSQIVSEVMVSLSPTAAAISPANTCFTSSRSFACIRSIRTLRMGIRCCGEGKEVGKRIGMEKGGRGRGDKQIMERLGKETLYTRKKGGEKSDGEKGRWRKGMEKKG